MAAVGTGIADPAPLGLAAFALTTFLLSAFNAGWMTTASGLAWLGYAFAYGGLGQLLAGMWEFRNRNVFGATAFSSYGGFWIGLGLDFVLVGRGLLAHPVAGARGFSKDVGWILLAFAIFNTYMLIWSTQVNAAVFAVFLTLEAHRDHPVHRQLLGQQRHRQVRRVRRRAHRGVRLVRLGGRGRQRDGQAGSAFPSAGRSSPRASEPGLPARGAGRAPG